MKLMLKPFLGMLLGAFFLGVFFGVLGSLFFKNETHVSKNPPQKELLKEPLVSQKNYESSLLRKVGVRGLIDWLPKNELQKLIDQALSRSFLQPKIKKPRVYAHVLWDIYQGKNQHSALLTESVYFGTKVDSQGAIENPKEAFKIHEKPIKMYASFYWDATEYSQVLMTLRAQGETTPLIIRPINLKGKQFHTVWWEESFFSGVYQVSFFTLKEPPRLLTQGTFQITRD